MEVTDFFLNPQALAMSAIIVPIIILYLLKPKPKRIEFPSIMFILRIEKTKRFRSWFKRFVRDPLLLVQILIILLFVASLAKPFLLLPVEKNPKEDIVIIIDGAASMQSTDVSPNRFEKAKELAANILNDVNPESLVSVIFSENTPILILKRKNKESAKSIISRLRPSDSPSNLQDAILFGNDLLSDSKLKKKMYVFSDFSNVGDVELARGISQNKGTKVEFVKIFKGGKNIGLTSIKGDRFLTKRGEFYITFVVKNFNINGEVENVLAELLLDGKVLTTMPKIIYPGAEALFHLKGSTDSEEHELKIRLKNNYNDNFALDDVGYWVLPKIKKYRILLITNHDIYLKNALEANPDFIVDVAEPPLIPKLSGYDTIILGDIESDLILPGTFFDLKKLIEDNPSVNVIIMASDGLSKIKNKNLNDILPVSIGEVVKAKSQINVKKKHESIKDVILENVIMEKYLKTTEKNESTIIATIKNMPVLSFKEHFSLGSTNNEKGSKVVYVGINPNKDWSNFYLSSSFPIFWSQLIKWINRKDSLSVVNLKAGEYMSLPNELNLNTPSGVNIITSELVLDEVGFYNSNKKSISGPKNSSTNEKFSVNLINDDESNIMKSINVKTINDPDNFKIYHETVLKETTLTNYLFILILVLLAVEVIIYKRRGLI